MFSIFAPCLLSALIPILIFVHKPKFRSLALILAFAPMFLLNALDFYDVLKDNYNIWGLLQHELRVSKSVFLLYKGVCLIIYTLLLWFGLRKSKACVFILACFVLCNLLIPFNLMEQFLLGR